MNPKQRRQLHDSITGQQLTPEEIEQEAIGLLPLPNPIPETGDQPGGDTSQNDGVLGGLPWLIAGGGIIIVTVGEDVATLGAGVVDDPASFAAAFLCFKKGFGY